MGSASALTTVAGDVGCVMGLICEIQVLVVHSAIAETNDFKSQTKPVKVTTGNVS